MINLNPVDTTCARDNFEPVAGQTTYNRCSNANRSSRYQGNASRPALHPSKKIYNEYNLSERINVFYLSRKMRVLKVFIL